MASIKITPADKWFSYYIRLSDCIYGEYGPCMTCGKTIHWKSGDCGHFQSRGKPMTRFMIQNCGLQCTSCNRFKSGEQFKFSKAIDKKWGEGTAERIENLARIRGQKIHTKYQLKLIATEYRLKAKRLAKLKGIEIW